MSHAMDPNGKRCMVCVYLFSDPNFNTLVHVFTPLAPKQSSFLVITTKLKPSPFYKASMMTIVRLSALVPSTTF
jgi:hypothetical protein